jgi:hypothetical protein
VCKHGTTFGRASCRCGTSLPVGSSYLCATRQSAALLSLAVTSKAFKTYLHRYVRVHQPLLLTMLTWFCLILGAFVRSLVGASCLEFVSGAWELHLPLSAIRRFFQEELDVDHQRVPNTSVIACTSSLPRSAGCKPGYRGIHDVR